MNKTYLVEDTTQSPIERKKSLNANNSLLFASKRNKSPHAQEQQMSKKRQEIKVKLNQMKKRTKLLLKNHNWRKYFADEPQQEEQNKMTKSLSETMFKMANDEDLNSILSENYEEEEGDDEYDDSSIFTDSSFVSTYKLNNQAPSGVQHSKLNLFNYHENDQSVAGTTVTCLPQLSYSGFSNSSAPFTTSEMFQVMSNCSIGGVGGVGQISKTSLSTVAVPIQKNTMKFVNTLITTNTPVSIKRKQFNLVQGNICASLFKVSKINQQLPLLSSSSNLLHEETCGLVEKKTTTTTTTVKFSPIVKLEKLTSASSAHHRRLRRQPQSLTFIADLASTSTPTRVSQQPIASTPKMSCHDPLKYHPTHTIRNKTKKTVVPVKITRKTKQQQQPPSSKLHCHLQISRIETVKSLDNNNIKKRGGGATKRTNVIKKRNFFASELNLDCLKYTAATRQQLDEYSQKIKHKTNIHFTALNYKHQHDYNTRPKRCAGKVQNIIMAKNNHRVTKRKASAASFVSSFSSINSCDNCNICNINGIVTQLVGNNGGNVQRLIKTKSNKLKRKKIQQQPPSSSKIKFKAANFEISLEDLLYAPAKIRNLEPIPSSNVNSAIVRSTPPVGVVGVNSGSSSSMATAANAASKVYYL